MFAAENLPYINLLSLYVCYYFVNSLHIHTYSLTNSVTNSWDIVNVLHNAEFTAHAVKRLSLCALMADMS